MKSILEFNLPEDQSDFDMCNNARHYYSALWEIHNQLRQWRKYENKETLTMEEVDEMFFNAVGGLLDG
jgi:hypothetical protein